jgi:hypothetical protein
MRHRLVVLSFALASYSLPAWGQAVVTPPPASSTSNNSLYYNKMHWAGTWNATVTYNSQDVVGSAGISYVSLVPLNVGNAPSTALTWWTPLPNAPPFGSLGNFVSLTPLPISGPAYNQSSFRVQRGNSPPTREYGFGTVSLVQTIVGSVDIPAGTYTPSGGGMANGIVGISATGTAAWPAVGVYGAAMVTSNDSGISAFGANFVVSNYDQSAAGSNGTGHNNSNLYGLEVDVNNMTPSASNIRGIYVNGGSLAQGGSNDGVLVSYLGAFGSPPIKWTNGFRTDDGGSQVGLNLGLATVSTVGNSGSQPIQLNSWDGTTRRFATITTDPSGNLAVIPGAGGSISLEDGGGRGALSVQPAGVNPYVNVASYIELGATGGGARITTGSGAPAGTCVTGSIYLRTDASATPLYVCSSTAWASVTIP